ncbi:MAG: methyltransferase domain-containing protein [Armatimonadota bacterium]
MHRSLVDILVDPISRTTLQVEVKVHGAENKIVEGTLHGAEGRSYPITNGIPRFVFPEGDRNQRQTAVSFGFKWHQRNTYDSPQVHANARKWLIQRYGFKDVNEMRDYFQGRKILDAGCGSGFSTSLWMNESWGGRLWVGVDISTAIDVAQARLGSIENTHFIQADICQLPFREKTFDTIFAEGVLHHTPCTELALKSLMPFLESGGEIMFYVYRKKGPIREFTDDYIRNIVSGLGPEEAWAMIRPLTKLGQALAELRVEVKVPEDIPYLGIKAGVYDIQRLIYWHFAKLFWNEAFTFEENNHVNFDWYHPRYAHRHTEEEIRRWCDEAGLSIIHFDIQESGFTVRALKG